MPSTLIQRGFAAGELAPGLAARADLAKYVTAARTVRNFIVRRQGGVANRPGTKYLATTKTSGGGRAYLKRFVFKAASASFAIECGDNYFRFFKNGAAVVVAGVTAYDNAHAYAIGDLASSAGVNYYCIAATTGHAPPNVTYWYPLTGNIFEVPTPYPAGAFAKPDPACFSQQGTVITITHLNYAPQELTYGGADAKWTLIPITTGPSIAAPSSPAGTPGAAGTRTYSYVVTARKADSYEESNPSGVAAVALAVAPTVDAPNVVTWAAVAGTAQYDVYGDGAEGNGVFGYVGSSTGLAFNDPGTAPDYTRVPPVPRTLFNAANLYPAVNVVYEQRQVMAGTHTDREQVFASRVGFRKNFGIRTPLQDDDAVTFTIASALIQPVQHLVPVSAGLVVLTDSGEWVVQGDGQTGTILPTAINPRQHGFVGADQVRPVVIGETVIFVQALGTVLRDLRFDLQVQGLSGRDLTLYSAHLFTGFSIVDMAYAQVPDSVVWCVRSDGALLGLTYIKDEDVWGWHRHDTDGLFESICTIPEGNEDAVYVIVQRTIGGVVKRYVERFASRQFTDIADACFVDAGATYAGAATTLITGLLHLAGETVNVLADGVVPSGTFVVAGDGTLTIPTAAAKVQIGLPITAELETLDLDVAGSAIRDKQKRVGSISLLLEASSYGFLVGPDADHLLTQTPHAWDAAAPMSGQVEMNLTSGFNNHGRTLIRQTAPLPLTVLGVLPNVEVGG